MRKESRLALRSILRPVAISSSYVGAPKLFHCMFETPVSTRLLSSFHPPGEVIHVHQWPIRQVVYSDPARSTIELSLLSLTNASKLQLSVQTLC